MRTASLLYLFCQELLAVSATAAVRLGAARLTIDVYIRKDGDGIYSR